MKIKSEIIYTDTIYCYKKPVPGYICSILSANDPDGKNLNILEMSSLGAVDKLVFKAVCDYLADPTYFCVDEIGLLKPDAM